MGGGHHRFLEYMRLQVVSALFPCSPLEGSMPSVVWSEGEGREGVEGRRGGGGKGEGVEGRERGWREGGYEDRRGVARL